MRGREPCDELTVKTEFSVSIVLNSPNAASWSALDDWPLALTLKDIWILCHKHQMTPAPHSNTTTKKPTMKVRTENCCMPARLFFVLSEKENLTQ